MNQFNGDCDRERKKLPLLSKKKKVSSLFSFAVLFCLINKFTRTRSLIKKISSHGLGSSFSFEVEVLTHSHSFNGRYSVVPTVASGL